MRKVSILFFVCLLGATFNAAAQGHEKGNLIVSIGYGMGTYDFRNDIPMVFYLDLSPHDYGSLGPYLAVLMGEDLTFDIGARGNFHWWQLLDDKIEKDLKARTLDFYASVFLGAKIRTNTYAEESTSFTAGGMAGFRWYFVPAMGLMAEIGWPPHEFATVGFSFRINPF